MYLVVEWGIIRITLAPGVGYGAWRFSLAARTLIYILLASSRVDQEGLEVNFGELHCDDTIVVRPH